MAEVTTELVVRDFAEGVIEGIKSAMPKSSGKSAQSLFYRYDGKRLQIGSTEGWFTVFEHGRKPGKRPPIDPLEDWVKREIANVKNPRSIAFAIANKMSEEGSLLYRKGGNSGVISDYINLENVHENLTVPLKDHIVKQIVSILNRN